MSSYSYTVVIEDYPRKGVSDTITLSVGQQSDRGRNALAPRTPRSPSSSRARAVRPAAQFRPHSDPRSRELNCLTATTPGVVFIGLLSDMRSTGSRQLSLAHRIPNRGDSSSVAVLRSDPPPRLSLVHWRTRSGVIRTATEDEVRAPHCSPALDNAAWRFRFALCRFRNASSRIPNPSRSPARLARARARTNRCTALL